MVRGRERSPDILDREMYHEDCNGQVQAARNPGGTWVVFEDLPEATYEALWTRNGHKLVFPYGVGISTYRKNKPPVAEPPAGCPKRTDVMTIGELLLHRHSPNYSKLRAMSGNNRLCLCLMREAENWRERGTEPTW